jgi:hypothetical protein
MRLVDLHDVAPSDGLSAGGHYECSPLGNGACRVSPLTRSRVNRTDRVNMGCGWGRTGLKNRLYYSSLRTDSYLCVVTTLCGTNRIRGDASLTGNHSERNQFEHERLLVGSDLPIGRIETLACSPISI